MILCLLAALATSNPACAGEERWAQKTLADASSKGVSLSPLTLTNCSCGRSRCGTCSEEVCDCGNPVVATIAEMTALPASKWGNAAPRTGEELKLYHVTGRLVGFKLEADQDFHVVLADEAGKTMIVEFADPACAKGSTAAALITAARAQFLKYAKAPTAKFVKVAAAKPLTCTAIGPLFFDKIHGQTGVAKNGVEIHPVLQWTCEKADR